MMLATLFTFLHPAVLVPCAIWGALVLRGWWIVAALPLSWLISTVANYSPQYPSEDVDVLRVWIATGGAMLLGWGVRRIWPQRAFKAP